MKRPALFFLLFVSLMCRGQVEINWFEKQEFENRGNDYHQVLGITANQELVVISGNSGSFLNNPEYFLETFSVETGKSQLYNRLSLPFLERKENKLKRFVLLEDQLIVLYTSYNRKREKNYLIGVRYNQLGAPISEPVVLDSVTTYSSSRKGTFHIAENPQKTKLLVYPIPAFEVTTEQKLHFSIFNGILQRMYNRTLEIPYKSREFELEQMELNEDDKAFFLVKITNLFKRWNPGQPNFKYVVIETTPESNEIKEFEIRLDKLSISDISITLDSQRLYIAGLYSKQAKVQSESIGLFFISIDTEKRAIVSSNFQQYPMGMLEFFLNPSQLAKEKELDEFKIRHLFPKKDGTFSLILEQYIYRQVCNTDIRTGVINCQDNYYYNDIALLTLSEKGKVTSFSLIPKTQYSGTEFDFSNSFIALNSPHIDVLLFNDDPKNLKDNYKDKPRTYSLGSRSHFVAATLGPELVMNYKEVKLEGLERNQVVMPRRSVKLSGDTVVVYADNRNVYQFGILTFTAP